MLTVKTSVRPSAIHGNGVFAEERVLQGETVWTFEPTFDRVISEAEIELAPRVFRDFLDMYAYRSSDMDGALVLSCDNARYLNHSVDPNTLELPFKSIARRTIEIGDEMTCDYGAFCTDGLGFDASQSAPPTRGSQSTPPHHNLYTRIKPCSAGVGVFAIRDIPEGADPFAGDVGEVVSVPSSEVEKLEQEFRRMYRDFCPLVGNVYVAPKDFNQMTVGWFLNHSKSPNVRVMQGMRFVTARRILCGEELTTDYVTYSAHANRFDGRWED